MDNLSQNQTIGHRITFLQALLNMSNKEFSEKVEVDASQMSKIKANAANLPPHLPIKLSELWNVNLHWLYTGQGEWNIIPRETNGAVRADILAKGADRLIIFEAKLFERTEAHIADLKKHNEDLNKIIHSGLVDVKSQIKEIGSNLKEASATLESIEDWQWAESKVMMESLSRLEKKPPGTLSEEAGTLLGASTRAKPKNGKKKN